MLDSLHFKHTFFIVHTLLYAFLYTKSNETISLNDFRFKCFQRSSLRKTFDLSILPPTEDAAALHSLRIYYQIRLWLGDHEKDPEKWGWIATNNGLLPQTSTAPMLPPELASIISCSCVKGCSGNCSCRKFGICCSVLCKNCEGKNCENVDKVKIIDDLNDNDSDKNGFLDIISLDLVVTNDEEVSTVEQCDNSSLEFLLDESSADILYAIVDNVDEVDDQASLQPSAAKKVKLNY